MTTVLHLATKVTKYSSRQEYKIEQISKRTDRQMVQKKPKTLLEKETNVATKRSHNKTTTKTKSKRFRSHNEVDCVGAGRFDWARTSSTDTETQTRLRQRARADIITRISALDFSISPSLGAFQGVWMERQAIYMTRMAVNIEQ